MADESTPAAAPKAPAAEAPKIKPAAAPKAPAAETATGTYLNPNGSATACNAGPAKDGKVDLYRPGEKEPFCTDCTVSKEPAAGKYTPA